MFVCVYEMCQYYSLLDGCNKHVCIKWMKKMRDIHQKKYSEHADILLLIFGTCYVKRYGFTLMPDVV